MSWDALIHVESEGDGSYCDKSNHSQTEVMYVRFIRKVVIVRRAVSRYPLRRLPISHWHQHGTPRQTHWQRSPRPADSRDGAQDQVAPRRRRRRDGIS
jgi:hypothetical protein